MKRSRLSRVVAFLTLFSLLFQLTAVAQDATPTDIPDGILNVQLTDDQGTALTGCVTVTDASGVPHTDCTYDGGGWIVFTGLPSGAATVINTETAAGHYQAEPQYPVIMDGAAATVTMVSAVVPVPTEEPTEVPTQEPTEVPTEIPTEAPTEEPTEESPEVPAELPTEEPTEVSTEEPTEVPTEEPVGTPGDDVQAKRPNSLSASRNDDGMISPMAFGQPGIACFPKDYNQGADITVFVPAKESDPAPTFTYTETDRFGNVTEYTTPITMGWDVVDERYEFSTFSNPSATVDFSVMIEGRTEPVLLQGACAQFNPLPLNIQTVAVDGSNTAIPNGGRINSGTPFGDTAEFVSNYPEFIHELEGQQVTYNLYKDDGTCGGTPVWTQTVTVGADGVIPASDLYTPTEDGVYDWQVVFAGNENFQEAASPCGSETVVVGSAEVTVRTAMQTSDGTTIPQNGSVPLGTAVRDTTTLAGAAGDATGTVTYTLYQGEGCDGTAVYGPETVTVSGGEVSASSLVENLGQGTYHWVVVYSGDANNNGDTSECGEETFTIGKWQPTVTTAMLAGGEPLAQGGTVERGTSVSDTATLSNAYDGATPTGTVTYTLYRGSCPGGDVVGASDPLPLNADGTLPNAPSLIADAVGTYNWVVEYSGDENNASAISDCGSETFNVTKNLTSITTTPQLRTGEEGNYTFSDIDDNGVVQSPADVRDTAVVSGLTEDATGSVTFTLYSGATCGDDPIATFTVDLADAVDGVLLSGVAEGLKPGQYNWTATYTGDGGNEGSESGCYEEQFFVSAPGVGGYVGTTVMSDDTGDEVPNYGNVPLGTTVHDTAQFYGTIADDEGNAAVGGSLTYTLYSGDTCADVVDSWTVDVTAGEPVPAMSASHQFVNAGTYNFQAVFTPDGGDPISSPCNTEGVVVDKATTSIETVMHSGDDVIAPQGRITRPASVSDGVNVSFSNQALLDGIDGPDGTVTYELYNNAGCDDSPVFTSQKDVVNGVFPDSDLEDLTEENYGVYNWVVTFTPAGTESNYSGATSDCGSETFYLDAQPELSTAMFSNESNDGDGSAMADGGELTVGDYVRDTATMTGFAPGASGTVTFTLHQGLTCEGIVMFEDEVSVDNGEIESTGWYQIPLHGSYSWQAVYSGDNTNGGFNKSATHCLNETFTVVPADGDPTMVTVMRKGEDIVPHLSYVNRPATVTDEAVFTNLSDQATGTVTYELYSNANCAGDAVFTDEQTVANGLAPRSEGYTLPEVQGADSNVYSWVVTFEGMGEFADIVLTSDCGEEQFRLFNSTEYSASTTCSYNPDDDTMSFTVYLSPRDVNDHNDTPVVVTLTPFNRDLSPVDTITLTNPDPWVFTYTNKEWRRVEGRADWNGGSSWATFSIGCNTSPFQPEITTEMYVDGDPDTVLDNGAAVEPGTVVYDTTHVEDGTSTVVMSGTLTYELYRGEVCDTENSQLVDTTTRTLDGTAIGELPASNPVTITEVGTYFWVVTYDPGSVRYPDNLRAVSDCQTESFQILSPVMPVTPTVSGNACTGGEYAAPQIDLATGPDGVSYEVTQDVDENGDYVVIATLSGDQKWDADSNSWPAGWTANDDGTATYNGHVDLKPCTPVLPITPSSTDGVCAGGEYTPPTVTEADGPEGVSYDIGDIDPETGEYTVTATLTDGLSWNTESAEWPENWTVVEGDPSQAVFEGTVDLNECTPIMPLSPNVTGNACTGGEYTAPSVSVADEREFVVYDIGSVNMETGEYTVSVTLADSYSWDTGSVDWPEGWTVSETDPAKASFTDTIELQPCDPVTPVNPVVDGNVCTGGEYTPPTVSVNDPDSGITYEIGSVNMETGEYTVTATLADGQEWDDLTDTGWTETDSATATYTDTLDLNFCIEVTPVNPTVNQTVCTGGALTEPLVVTTDTESIAYSFNADDVVNGGTVIVTATLADTFGWPETMPEGWTDNNDGTASFTVELEDVQCTPVVPVNPEVVNTVCTGGELTDPTVTPATTEGIEYTVDGDVVNGGTVTVIATLEDDYGWPAEMPEGWTINEVDNTASYTVELDDVQCTPVVPVDPVVEQAVCTGGELVPPTVSPTDVEGITYEIDGGIAPGSTVVIIATVEDRFSWGELPDGWTKVDNATATYELTLEDIECETVIPAAPIVNNAVCTGGGLTEPTITLQETKGIEYSAEGDVVNGGTVVVTATLDEGKAWGDMPEGWTKVDTTTATFTVTLDEVSCEPAVHLDPIVTQPVCTDGVVQKPTVTTPETPGVVYTIEGDLVPGGTVIVTATVQDGYSWPEVLGEGWTKVDDATATYTVVLDDVECTPVDPGQPVVNQPECKEGDYQKPDITLPETPGVTYTIEGDLVPGGTVVIRATFEAGYTWGTLPDGWTLNEDGSASFTVTFDDVTGCEIPAATPVAPESPVTKLPTTGNGGSTLSATSMAMLLLASLAGITAAVAAWMRREGAR